MFNKFSNPESFMAGYKDALAESAATAAPSTANSTMTSAKPMNSVPSNSKTSSVNKTPSTPSTNPNAGMIKTPSNSVPMKEADENNVERLFRLSETPGQHKERLNKIIFEHMDINDLDTVKQAYSLNEAEQNTFLLSLTNKLYQMIVDKIDDVDFGDIPKSKGNIRNYSKYKQLKECIEVLIGIFDQYKEDTKPVQVLDNTLSNLENNSDIFMAGYASDIDMVKMTYETATLGLIQGIGFMIAVCIEYVKTPRKEGLQITLNKTGIRKVKDHLVYENLIKFNDACSSGDLERALRPLIKERVKNITFVGAIGAVRVVIAIGVIVAAIIPFLRQLVYFFYSSRVRMSTYLDTQADLLEMNATELRNNDSIQTVDDKKRVVARQLKIAGLFHSTANKIAVDSKTAEVSATKSLKDDTKRYKMDEVESNPANSVSDGPLF